MRYARTIAPAETPISLDEAKAACSIAVENTDLDDWITLLIAEAVDTIEKRLCRQFMAATWTLALDEFPEEILLERLPITGVTSIVYIDDDGQSQTLTADQYQIDLGGANSPARIKPVEGLTWPSTQSGTYNTVVVTFTAGAALADDVAPSAKRAVKFLVAHWFRNHEPVGPGQALEVPATFDFVLCAEDWGNYQ